MEPVQLPTGELMLPGGEVVEQAAEKPAEQLAGDIDQYIPDPEHIRIAETPAEFDKLVKASKRSWKQLMDWLAKEWEANYSAQTAVADILPLHRAFLVGSLIEWSK